MEERTIKDVHPAIREFYNRAVDFERKQNWDFAANTMAEVVIRVPGFLAAREKLREYERNYTRSLKGSAPFMSKLKGFFAIPKIKKLIGTNPLDALTECEKLLVENLNNPPILNLLAEAGLKADAPNIAIEAMLILHDYLPNDINVMRRLAKYYKEDGQAQEALKVYQHLASRNPKDKKILAELREASLYAAQQKAAQAKTAEPAAKSVKDDALTIQLAEGTLRDADHARKLVELYTKELAENDSDEMRKKLAEAYNVCGDYDKAIENLELVASHLPAVDPTLDKQIERLYLTKYKSIVDDLRKRAKADPSLQGNLEEAEQFLLEFRIERAEARVKAYPAEALLRYDLGMLYLEGSRYDDAMTEFQEAAQSPSRRTQANAAMGSCEYQRGNFEQAVHFCDLALKEMVRMDRHRFEVMYTRADALEKLGKTAEALEGFQEIYRNNVRFRDVAQRVTALGGTIE